jgi:predicted  nucleic acid-binding Zn-ribbon protein
MHGKELTENMDVWRDRVTQDINDLKQRQQQNEGKLANVEADIHKLQVSDKLQDKEISSLKEALSEIKDDTSWIRRRITGALITAVITAVVGGIAGIAIANIF